VALPRQSGSERARIGLALAGGGPTGAVYEIGAVRALDEVLDGFDLDRMHVYVGVSAGSFIASCLANGITTQGLCRSTIEHDPSLHPFSPEIFFRSAPSWSGSSTSRVARTTSADCRST
jgi:predicted acylesterase/phospholipase RssA